MRITVIGESNIDIAVKPCSGMPQTSANTCVPSHISFHHGGVARNIAHNLRLLGHEVRLMTVFGDDDFALRLIEDCEALGMDLSLSSQCKDAQSPIFLSFNDEKGNMQSAASDVALNDRMDLDWLKGKMEEINRSDIVVADTLISAEALSYLIDSCAVPLYIDTVSPGKAKRFLEAMQNSTKHSVHALKCNLSEALALTRENDAEAAAQRLNSMGASQVYLTLGEKGALFCAKGITKHYPSLSAKIVDVTGSGDAFFAGVIHGHSTGCLGEKAIPFGLEAARQTIQNEGPVAQSLEL